jgi:hypothetical protein
MGPYFGKYAGYELTRGRLTLDAQAHLEDEQLDLRNKVTIEQLALGAPTNSPDAVKAPVRLGVALLTDTNGRIVLDVPVQGSLTDPTFKPTGVFGRVLANLLTKAASAPFSFLGAMFGGGGDELARDEFAPGGATLTPESIRRLDTVHRALVERPELYLEIRGGYDVLADTAALQAQRLDELVRRRAWETRHAIEPGLVEFDHYQAAPAEATTAMAALYVAKFPNAAGSDSTGASPSGSVPTPTAAAAPQPDQRGFFRRLLNLVTFGTIRSLHSPSAPTPARVAKASSAASRPVAAPTVAPEEMRQQLAAALPVTTEDLEALATARAQVVRGHLLEDGKVPAGRILVAQTVAPLGARAILHLE